MNDSNPVPGPNMYDNRLKITSPGKLPMGQTIERMKEGYSKIRNEALAHAFAYMNLIEHWGSGIPRIIDKVKAAGLREPEFIGGEVDLRINIYRGQVDTNNAIINANGTKSGADDGTNGAEVPLNKEQTQIEKLLQIIEKNPSKQICRAFIFAICMACRFNKFFTKKISTHILTVLTISAILKNVIRNYLYKTQPLRVTFLKSRGSCVLYIKIGE